MRWRCSGKFGRRRMRFQQSRKRAPSDGLTQSMMQLQLKPRPLPNMLVSGSRHCVPFSVGVRGVLLNRHRCVAQKKIVRIKVKQTVKTANFRYIDA
ncbi:hypothetical protein EVAR_4402_1 [Eumeta japonica]|uniref:Uncharacterized protein n=1 Tax=Eumeta variegata TaxID=151549 RepID=A0A4C1T127_EUMVA|nr:hypothetical protein EVAR_4402_1 [Eumeta japonica]